MTIYNMKGQRKYKVQSTKYKGQCSMFKCSMFKSSTLLCLMLLTLTISFSGCSDDDEIPSVPTPSNKGTFVDERDGKTYHWVRYGNLDWMVENAGYYLDTIGCTVYQPDSWDQNYGLTFDYLEKYGCLYSVSTAEKLAPEGWRVPTDAEWQSLEMQFGMSASDASSRDWRGNIAQNMMLQQENYGGINIQPTGYFTNKTGGSTTGYRLIGVEGFFWTSTQEEGSEQYYYRKFFYSKPEVYRETTESGNMMMSVRWVRDAI